VLAALLVARGIKRADEAFTFLNPEMAHLHDPLRMKGMEAAVERLERQSLNASRSFSMGTTTSTAQRRWCC